MPTNLTNSNISETYQGVLHANGELPPSGQAQIYDGVGNKSAITLGQEDGGITITGNLNVEGSINGNSITGNTINGGGFSKSQEIIDLVYPVGSIDNVNPDDKFLGANTTWVRVAEGKFIAGVGEGTDANGTIEEIVEGDNSNGEYNVTLDESQMPSHRHDFVHPDTGERFYAYNDANGKPSGANVVRTDGPNASNDGHIYPYTNYAGGDAPHTNIPPYMGMYIWKRTN
jgi:hypothetical protein